MVAEALTMEYDKKTAEMQQADGGQNVADFIVDLPPS